MSANAPQQTPSPFSRHGLRLMRRGPFARYAAGEIVSMTGTWMQAMAQSWVMTSLTTHAFWLGMVNFTGSFPMLALTMIGGSFADRHDKRKIIIVTQIVQILLAMAVGWLVMTHRVHIWHILVAAFLLGISASFEMPASAAFVPELVGKENIATAIGIDRSIFHGTRLLGPALAGYVIGIWGTAAAFYGNAASFLALIAAVASTPARTVGTVEEEKQRSSGMKAGIDFVRQDRATMAMLALMASGSLCVFPFIAVMMPLYSRDELRLGAQFTGFLMAVSGIGSLTGSIGLLSVPRARRVYWMSAAAAAIVLALAGLSLARAFWEAALCLILLTTGTAMNFGLANTTVQERAPGPLRGRVSALAMLSFVGVMPFASLAMTGLADYAGMRWAMDAGAAAYGIAAFFILTNAGRASLQLPGMQDAGCQMQPEPESAHPR